jgi:hypothetical protein
MASAPKTNRYDDRNGGNFALRSRVDNRLAALETYRWSWWTHWAELARYIIPRRYIYLVTPNQWNRGSPINQAIIDSTAAVALRILKSGMMSGITSPSRPWFVLTSPDKEVAEDYDCKLWFEETASRMMRVMAGSNYYTAKAQQYEDLALFGTAPMIIYEDNDTVIRCYNPCAGEYYAACGARFSVDTLYRKFTMTVQQVVDEFGLENVTQAVRTGWESKGAGLDREIIVAHAIEPNPDYVSDPGHPGPGGASRGFKWREIYWEWGSGKESILRVRGFSEIPFGCPRWDVTGNDAYGRSPGMDALGDVKQLQLEQKRKAQGIDKMVNPPMVASASMKNEPASLLPGAVTYVPELTTAEGFKPVYIVNPDLRGLMEDIQECQSRIKNVFFNDIFLMISQLDTVRTATEIDARRSEQLIQLGPVLERFENEGLAPDIQRIFGIMMRAGLLPRMPDLLRQRPQIKVDYVSMLAQAQAAADSASIERILQVIGGVSAIRPEAVDKINIDETIDVYGEKIRVPTKILNSAAMVAQMRQQRQQAKDQEQAMQVAQAGVAGAKVLSETDLGGGQSVLSSMLQGSQL